ncbi:MAG TPA: NAD(+) synthase [Eubacterium sp.]|nr:NAD(+) synthase [Eubacterium sp.]
MDMKDGFIRVCAATPDIRVADCAYNEKNIMNLMDEAYEKQVSVLVFPELCITGYTCGDLFLQDVLLKAAQDSLRHIVSHSAGKNMLVFVGMPFMHKGKLFNVAAAICDGRLLGLVPKKNIPNYSEFYEMRHFTPGMDECVDTALGVKLGSRLLFRCENIEELVVGAEICEDVWVACPPSTYHAQAGATLIVNCSASDETTGKDIYRRALISGQSARLVCGYIYANAGEGESTQDLVFGGQNLVCENGNVLAETRRFKNGTAIAELDLQRLVNERRRMNTYTVNTDDDYEIVDFTLEKYDLGLTRYYARTPFVPSSKVDRDVRCEEILSIQAMGLKKRLAHTGCRNAVIGISGGLDSTLALLVTARAFDSLSIPRENITAVTMPCFGTTDRTYNNAVELTRRLGATLTEVNIKEAVRIHFRDIGQDESVHDVTYENGQARERTQILMDIANKSGGMVIGTGDMSELALGWATYNGDHMSMYGVNCSVPKTLVRHLVKYYADTCGDSSLREILEDVLDTPVSPELLPPTEGQISQKTEDLVGPYELHDFFMYYILRFGYMPHKVYRIACHAFEGEYDTQTIYRWLDTFYRRFFAQQFKRSCLPDGPKVGSVAVSPRGDLRMPSDAVRSLWLEDLASINDLNKSRQ